MKKRVVQALGCLLAMTMVVGSLTACGGKSEKKSRKRCKGRNYMFSCWTE